ncbi:hypothetical protein [Novosphingobium sp. G106]|uniref:hypothetical protein n=1 Tax=Novosphingobium sp. G106 TaxID=2849500 RepID=UPI0020C4C49A|nr:hypothetical protein [Novosphingobium sp. G106]
MLQALGKEFDLGLVIRKPWRPGFPFFRRLIRRLSLGKIDLFWSRAWTRFGAGPTVEQLKRSDSDMVFVVAATPICALLTGTNKTVFVSDATQSAMVNYNPRHNALSANLKASAAELETTSISGSIAAFFPLALGPGFRNQGSCGGARSGIPGAVGREPAIGRYQAARGAVARRMAHPVRRGRLGREGRRHRPEDR